MWAVSLLDTQPMKNLSYLFALALVFTACKKEEEQPKMPVISGKVVDIQTQKGVPGVEVKVVDFWTDGWNYSVPITGSTTTDTLGNFTVHYTVKDQHDDRILKLGKIPLKYQRGARINEENEYCVTYDLFNDPYELFGGYRLEDEGTYTIELMPITFAYMVTPAIPSAWLADSIELITWDWINPLDDYTFGSHCSDNYAKTTFALKDNVNWTALNKPCPLKIGNTVTIQYKIYNGNTIRKSQQFQVTCAFADTTAINFPF
ncbi:MAG: carboxypeptidase regulatory-like domain-containing protein [Saprospiraceae bacterium]|nr:carboxypeptidase regulatory-like domain-containing protein [Saprospiraceae bacterium]